MTSINFIFRPSMKAGRHPGSLSLRVIHQRKPKTISLSCRLFPEEWDAVNRTILYPADDPVRQEYLEQIQEQLTACTGKINDIIGQLEKKGYYTTADIITRFRRASDNNKLLGFSQTLSEELREAMRFRTAKAYVTVSRGLVAFNKGVDIPLSQISSGLIKRFETHLKENGKQPNTISYYMRNLRAIYNKAVEAKRIAPGEEKPFAGVFTGVEETKKRALNADEVNRLKNIDFDKLLAQHTPGSQSYRAIESLYFSWRLFFFCLYAHGMSFVDMCHLKKSNLRGNEIRYYRKKTGGQVIVPMNDGMQKIIRSFSLAVKDSEYLFPILEGRAGNQQDLYETTMRTQNRRLKKLAELAQVEKTVSTHVARHSWATICKNELLPLSVISESLGHSSEKMTRKYLASFDHTVLGNAGQTVLSAISRPLVSSLYTSR